MYSVMGKNALIWDLSDGQTECQGLHRIGIKFSFYYKNVVLK
jgi:hypothetical protein